MLALLTLACALTISCATAPAARQESIEQWARHHPQAAETLMSHPGGLDWAGHHVYAGYWTMAKG